MPMDKFYPPPPKRAAPPSRFYRRYFTRAECDALDATSVDDLSSEINLLRVLLARLLAAARPASHPSLETQAGILSAFSSAGAALASLVRLQLKLHHPDDELQRRIEAWKNEGRRRMGVFDYFKPPAPA